MGEEEEREEERGGERAEEREEEEEEEEREEEEGKSPFPNLKRLFILFLFCFVCDVRRKKNFSTQNYGISTFHI